jgi:hypothetical protein
MKRTTIWLKIDQILKPDQLLTQLPGDYRSPVD